MPNHLFQLNKSASKHCLTKWNTRRSDQRAALIKLKTFSRKGFLLRKLKLKKRKKAREIRVMKTTRQAYFQACLIHCFRKRIKKWRAETMLWLSLVSWKKKLTMRSDATGKKESLNYFRLVLMRYKTKRLWQ